jgi:hypothetical protein
VLGGPAARILDGMTQQVRLFWGVLAITVVAAACGETPAGPGQMGDPPPVASVPFASGTSFVARFLRAPGTVPLLLSVHDRTRGLDCLLIRDAAGHIRCTSADTADAPSADPAALVEGQLRAVALNDRLSLMELLTPDGGRFPLVGSPSFLEDAHWQGPCAPTGLKGGDVRCLPAHATNSYLFADAGCFDPVVQQVQDAEPLLAVVDGLPRALGELFTGPVHVGFGGSCNPLPTAYHAPLRRPGARLPDDALLRLHPLLQGSDRLGLLALEFWGQLLPATRDPRQRLAPSYFDRQQNVDCAPVRTPEGVRCLAGVPFAAESELRFMDPRCTQPVLPQTGTEVVLLAGPDGHPLARATEIRKLGEWYGGPVVDVYRREGGICQLRPEKNTFRPLTTAGDWSRFAPLEEWLGDHRL